MMISNIHKINLEQKVYYELQQMSSMLSELSELSKLSKEKEKEKEKEINRQLIQMAENVLNFLFVLKSQGKTVNLDQYGLDQMITALENIQINDLRKQKIRKRHLSNFLYNLKYFNCIRNM